MLVVATDDSQSLAGQPRSSLNPVSPLQMNCGCCAAIWNAEIAQFLSRSEPDPPCSVQPDFIVKYEPILIISYTIHKSRVHHPSLNLHLHQFASRSLCMHSFCIEVHSASFFTFPQYLISYLLLELFKIHPLFFLLVVVGDKMTLLSSPVWGKRITISIS